MVSIVNFEQVNAGWVGIGLYTMICLRLFIVFLWGSTLQKSMMCIKHDFGMYPAAPPFMQKSKF